MIEKVKIGRHRRSPSNDTGVEALDEDRRTEADLGRTLIASRDPGAYCELLARTQHRSFRFAPQGCPDAVEAVLWRWFERGAGPYSPDRPFGPFFTASIRNEHIARSRRRFRPTSLDDIRSNQEPADPHLVLDQVLLDDARRRVVAAVAGLPERERAAITALFLLGLTFRAAAKLLRCSTRSLQRSEERALRMLAVALGSRAHAREGITAA